MCDPGHGFAYRGAVSLSVIPSCAKRQLRLVLGQAPTDSSGLCFSSLGPRVTGWPATGLSYPKSNVNYKLTGEVLQSLCPGFRAFRT